MNNLISINSIRSIIVNNSRLLGIILMFAGIVVPPSFVFGNDPSGFHYRIKNALEEDAEKFLVEKINFKTFHERFKPYCIYWGVIENDKPAVLTFHFPLEKPMKSGSINTNIVTCDFGDNNKFGQGKSQGSLWLSTDGKNWVKQFDSGLIPKGVYVHGESISLKIPPEFKGSQAIWVQLRMTASGMNDATYSTGQFGRNTPGDPNGSVFDLRVRY